MSDDMRYLENLEFSMMYGMEGILQMSERGVFDDDLDDSSIERREREHCASVMARGRCGLREFSKCWNCAADGVNDCYASVDYKYAI
jgi:hypothetical protein